MRKHDQILNNDQMSNPSSVISIYTIILLWKISVMLMIFVIWDTPLMSVLFLVIIMLIRVASIKMTVLWNESITMGDLWVASAWQSFKFVCVYSRMKGISVCCLTNNCEQLLIGTEIGNIYILDLNSFKLLDQIIYQDVVMQKSV